MVTPRPLPIPLLGALLIAEGYITPWHAEVCLLLQQHDYPHLSLAEIALRCGYLSASELDHAQQLQQELRSALTRAVEAHAPIPADLDVLIITDHPIAALTTTLTCLGATVRYAACPSAQPGLQAPDLILIDPARLPWCGTTPHTSLVALLTPDLGRWRNLDTAPLGMHTLLESYVRQTREYRSMQTTQARGAAAPRPRGPWGKRAPQPHC